MSLYPLRLTFNEGPQATTIVITRSDWKFATPADRSRFEAMPSLRRRGCV
jgi:hypothetical protein